MVGWERIEADTWEMAMELFPRPLLREFAAQDLRWHAGREIRGLGRRPSLDDLAERWGWVSRSGKPAVKKVRLLISSGKWEDPFAKGQEKGTERAGKGQEKGKPDTEETEESDKKGQGKGRERAGKGQGKGPTRVGDHPSPTPTPRTEDPPLPPKGGSTDRDPWSRTGKPTADDEPYVQRVWDQYRKHHTRCDATPADAVALRIIWAIRQRAKVNAKSDNEKANADPMGSAVLHVQLVLDWAHLAPTAAHLQGFDSYGKLKKKGGWLGVTNILKKSKFDDNLTSARDWLSDGKPRNTMLDNGHGEQWKEEAKSLWMKVGAFIVTGEKPSASDLTSDPAASSATDEALQSFQWDDYMRSDQYEARRYETAFVQAYINARRAT